jgi:hypothetical protein
VGNARNCTKFYKSTGSTGKTGFYSNQFENYSSSLEWYLGGQGALDSQRSHRHPRERGAMKICLPCPRHHFVNPWMISCRAVGLLGEDGG